MRTARRHGKSWTEIATMLTISRQSAWERWRELEGDGDLGAQPAGADRLEDGAVSELIGRARRRRMVVVPDLVGLTSAEALGILTHAGLEAVSATPGIELRESPDELRSTVVVRQYPDPGTRLRAPATVRLWLERGDGEAGVREPRRPTTPPLAARARRDERAEAAAVAVSAGTVGMSGAAPVT